MYVWIYVRRDLQNKDIIIMLCLWQRSTLRFLSSADQVARADKLSPFVRWIAIREPYRGGQQDNCRDKYAIFHQKFQIMVPNHCQKRIGIFFFNPIKGFLSAKSVQLSRLFFDCWQFSYRKIISFFISYSQNYAKNLQ